MRIIINLHYTVVVVVVVVVYKLVYTKTYPALVVNETMTVTLSFSASAQSSFLQPTARMSRQNATCERGRGRGRGKPRAKGRSSRVRLIPICYLLLLTPSRPSHPQKTRNKRTLLLIESRG